LIVDASVYDFILLVLPEFNPEANKGKAFSVRCGINGLELVMKN